MGAQVTSQCRPSDASSCNTWNLGAACDINRDQVTHGIEELPDGSIYEGQFRGWERHGHGKVHWADGSEYEGQFFRSDMHGKGSLTWKSGISYTGQWNKNRLGPRGEMSWPDGRYYCGQFQDGEKHSDGRLNWPDGKAYEGQWRMGKQHGYGLVCPGEGPPHLTQWTKGELVCWLDERERKRISASEWARAVLCSGAVRLLSATWLLEADENYIIQRRQDLPPEAFVEPEEAANLLEKRYGVVVLSYPWLTKSHPDPMGFHLRRVRQYLSKHVEYFTGIDTVGVFWDFASLPQRGLLSSVLDDEELTEEERGVFKVGVGVLSVLYGGKKTLVIQLTKLPEDSEDIGCKVEPCSARGWCFFEATVASILKDSDQLLDLSLAAQALEAEEVGWEVVRDAAVAARLPPLLPEDMEVALKKLVFANGDDRGALAGHYADFFADAAKNALVLDLASQSLANEGWGDAEVMQLCRALPAFKKCLALTLANHKALGEKGLASLRARLGELPALKRLVVPQHLQPGVEGQALVKAWSALGRKPENLVWLQKLPRLAEARQEALHLGAGASVQKSVD